MLYTNNSKKLTLKIIFPKLVILFFKPFASITSSFAYNERFIYWFIEFVYNEVSFKHTNSINLCIVFNLLSQLV
jgi:hypothetical protein